MVLHPEGLVLTNAHVVRRRRVEVATAEGTSLRGEVLAHDPHLDLAALMVEADDLPALEIGDSEDLEPGQWLLALGHPWGVAGAVTAGTVIGVGADLAEMPGAAGGREWVAVGLHLRPGNSGGPLVDQDGRLMGVNTIAAGPDIGLAVPAHVAKRFLRRELGEEARGARI